MAQISLHFIKLSIIETKESSNIKQTKKKSTPQKMLRAYADFNFFNVNMYFMYPIIFNTMNSVLILGSPAHKKGTLINLNSLFKKSF